MRSTKSEGRRTKGEEFLNTQPNKFRTSSFSLLTSIRSRIVPFIAIFVTGAMSIPGFLMLMLPKGKAIFAPYCQLWGWILIKLSGMRIVTEGIEGLDLNETPIVVANHESLIDTPLMAYLLKGKAGFLAKRSLFLFPIFGQMLWLMGSISIDKRNRTKAARSIEKAASVLAKGRPMIVFPEGGRTRTGKMQPFKRGAFLLAIRAQKKIQPVGIRGTYECMNPNTLRLYPGTVTVRFGKPIDTAGYTDNDRARLSDLTRAEIVRLVGESPADEKPTGKNSP